MAGQYFNRVLNVVRAWILLSTLLVSAGWILSAFHQLNRAGYGIVFALAAGALFLWQRKAGWRPQKSPAQLLQKLKFRFKHPAPLFFLALASLSLIAGSLYVPSNGDSNAYRIPRIMHWLSAQQWHWIRTVDIRLNVVCCNFEWLCAPLLLFACAEQCLFLPNLVSFLLLPGLIFSVFTRLQISPRVSWWWMWLLPSAWCFIMQAGSTINDSFAAVYALAAVDFGLRARENKNVKDLWFAMLSAALLTGVKQTVIPLALLGLITILPSLKLLLKRWIVSLGTIGACVLVSFVPITLSNLDHTGSWVGVSKLWERNELSSPFWGIAGNAFCITLENLKPPIFPFVGAWDEARKHFLQTPLGTHFLQFENFGQLSLGVGEANAGVGSGICFLLFISLWGGWYYRQRALLAGTAKKFGGLVQILIWLPWLLVLVFMAKNGAAQNARQLAAYYIFLFPSLLGGAGLPILIRRRWWQGLAFAIMFVAFVLLVISRDRPLFPSQTVMGWLQAKYPNSKFISRVADSYRLGPNFENHRMLLQKALPPDEKVIGLATVEGTAEPGLWFPLWRRSVMRVLPGDTPEQLRQARIHYIVVEDTFLHKNETIEQFASYYDATLVARWDFFVSTGLPRLHVYLVRLGQGN